MSDLHFEHCFKFGWNDEYTNWPQGGWPARADYLVLAGDISALSTHYSRLRDFLALRCQEYKRVFYLAGNREFPNDGTHTVQTGLQRARAFQDHESMNGKLTFMNRTRVDVCENGTTVSILGCTLWSRIGEFQYEKLRQVPLEGIPGNSIAQHNQRFERDFNWLKSEVAKIRAEDGGKERKILIATHHPPFIRGASQKTDHIKDTMSNTYTMYSNDILGGYGFEGLGAGDMWVYGHTHRTNDLIIDDVRVYSNQRGAQSTPLITNPKRNQFDICRIVDL